MTNNNKEEESQWLEERQKNLLTNIFNNMQNVFEIDSVMRWYLQFLHDFDECFILVSNALHFHGDTQR